MDLPSVWGQGGALFAFSGFDGETDWYHPFVGSTSWQGRGITFHTEAPVSIGLLFAGDDADLDVKDEVVAGDVISSIVTHKDASLRLRYLFLDNNTVVGSVTALDAAEPVEAGIRIDAESAKGERKSGVLVLRAGDEEFALAGEGPGFRVQEGGLVSRLSRGETLTFALTYLHSPSTGETESKANGALSVDQDKLFDDRLDFFRSLPKPQSDDRLLRETYYKCASVQKINSVTAQDAIEFDWTTPDRYPHRHMWIWDSAFHALGLRHFAPAWAKNAVKAVLSKQHADGFIPHTLTPVDEKDSHIIQPPIVGWAAWRVYETSGDIEFIRYCYPRLKAMIEWDLQNRDTDGSGLCEWESGGASGMDNSPRFDHKIMDAVDLNAYLANDMLYLHKMAEKLGLKDEASMWETRRDELSARINKLMWDDDTGFYYDLDREGRQIRLKTEAGFTPMFAGICSREQAASLVKHLTNPDEFWRGFPVASVSADEPSFSDDMWRGPVWINYNYLIIEALEKYRYREEAASLRAATIREIARWYGEDGVTYEFYDSEAQKSPAVLNRKGKSGVRLGMWQIGRCIRDYHWTAAIYLDLMLDR